MKHIKELAEQLRAANSPGAKIVEYAIKSSNRPAFIVYVAKLLAEAAQADFDEERSIMQNLHKTMAGRGWEVETLEEGNDG